MKEMKRIKGGLKGVTEVTQVTETNQTSTRELTDLLPNRSEIIDSIELEFRLKVGDFALELFHFSRLGLQFLRFMAQFFVDVFVRFDQDSVVFHFLDRLHQLQFSEREKKRVK